MENSNKSSSSSVQDVAQSPEKKNSANKSTKKKSPMKAAKNPVKMQKSKKQVAMSERSTTLESLKKKGTGKVFKKNLAKNTKNSPLNVKAAKNPAKKQDGILKKSTSTSESMKTRTASNRASLDSLMADFQIEGRAKTALGMPLKDFSESAVSLLMSNYKVENEKVLSTTALAM